MVWLADAGLRRAELAFSPGSDRLMECGLFQIGGGDLEE